MTRTVARPQALTAENTPTTTSLVTIESLIHGTWYRRRQDLSVQAVA